MNVLDKRGMDMVALGGRDEVEALPRRKGSPALAVQQAMPG